MWSTLRESGGGGGRAKNPAEQTAKKDQNEHGRGWGGRLLVWAPKAENGYSASGVGQTAEQEMGGVTGTAQPV